MLEKLNVKDRKAPRFRWTKGRHNVLSQDLFSNYRKDVENPIKDFSVFSGVINSFNEIIKDSVIENRDGVKLPAMMGILAMCSFKPGKRIPVNWAASEENGVKLKQFNLHTAGLACKLVYSCYTAKYKFRNWSLWRFKGNRDFTNKVSKAFQANYNLYKRLDNKSHVSKMFKDEYINKSYRLINESIRTNIEHKGNEQAD